MVIGGEPPVGNRSAGHVQPFGCGMFFGAILTQVPGIHRVTEEWGYCKLLILFMLSRKVVIANELAGESRLD